MTNERHEKALEAAVHADGFTPNEADRRVVARAIATYLEAMDAVIVPKASDSAMQNRGVEIYLTDNINDHSLESRIARIFAGMVEVAPNHFTNGE